MFDYFDRRGNPTCTPPSIDSGSARLPRSWRSPSSLLPAARLQAAVPHPALRRRALVRVPPPPHPPRVAATATDEAELALLEVRLEDGVLPRPLFRPDGH